MPENLSETDSTTEDESTDLDNETTEEAESEDSTDDGEESAASTVLIDGVEYSHDEAKEMKLAFDNRKHMQADYSRKTQAEAEKMKANVQLADDLSTLIDSDEAELSADIKAANLEQLEDEDPDQANKLDRAFRRREKQIQAKKDKLVKTRDKLNKEAVSNRNLEMQAILPEWFTANGGQTKAQAADLKAIYAFTAEMGYPDDYFNKTVSALEFARLKDSAELHALKAKKPGIKKKLAKAGGTVKEKKTVTGKKGINQKSSQDINSLWFNNS